jgi:hypothetical protein
MELAYSVIVVGALDARGVQCASDATNRAVDELGSVRVVNRAIVLPFRSLIVTVVDARTDATGTSPTR